MSGQFPAEKAYENLRPYQNDFFQLADLAGVHVNPLFVWVFIQLLNMKISPEATYKLLKLIKKFAKTSRSKKRH